MSDAIDVHCHYLPPALLELLAREGRGHSIEVSDRSDGTHVSFAGRPVPRAVPPGMLELEERLRWMDERGIALQVLSCWIDFSAYELDPDDGWWLAHALNDGLAEVVSSRRDRFRALGSVPLQAPERAAEELRRAVRELGMVGVEIASTVDDRPLDDPGLDPFWSAAAELGAVVLIHPHRALAGVDLGRYFLWNAVGNPAEETLAAAHLAFGGVLERHPHLDVCLTHGGGFFPYQVGRQDRAYRAVPKLAAGSASTPPSSFLGRFLYDSITHSPEALRFLVERVGAERVVLGSDYPFPMGDPDPAAAVTAAGLDDADAEAVLSGNARRAFRV